MTDEHEDDPVNGAQEPDELVAPLPAPEHPPVPLRGQKMETLQGKIALTVGVDEAVQKYVDRLIQYAAKGKYKMPPADPNAAHQFTVVGDRMVLWLMPMKPGHKYHRVRFIFSTEDDIALFVTEELELMDNYRLDAAERDIKRIIAVTREERRGRSDIIH